MIEIRELIDSHGKPLFVVYKDNESVGAFSHQYRAENLANWLRKESG
jgi:hypothetical protein